MRVRNWALTSAATVALLTPALGCAGPATAAAQVGAAHAVAGHAVAGHAVVAHAVAGHAADSPGGATKVWKRRNVLIHRGKWQTVGTRDIAAESKWTVSLQMTLDLDTATGNTIRGRNTSIGWVRHGWGGQSHNGSDDSTGAADNAIALRNDRLYQQSVSHELAGGGPLRWRVKVSGKGTVRATLLVFKATRWASLISSPGQDNANSPGDTDAPGATEAPEGADAPGDAGSDEGGSGINPSCLLGAAGAVLCAVAEVTSGAASSVAQNAADAVITTMANVMFSGWWMLQRTLMTSWVNLGTPGESDLVNLGGSTRGYLAWFTQYILIVSFLLAAGRTILARNPSGLADFTRTLVTTLVVSAVGATAVALMLQAGDALAAKLVRPTAEELFFNSTASQMMLTITGGGAPGVPVILGIIGIITAVVQTCILMGRNAILPVAVALLPLAAAAGVSTLGKSWFQRLATWTLALIVYKPVAGLIYAISFHQMTSPTANSMNAAFTALAGMVLAVLALPGLIKLFSPITAGGGGGGGGMAGGMAAGAVARGVSSQIGARAASGAAAGSAGGPPGMAVGAALSAGASTASTARNVADEATG